MDSKKILVVEDEPELRKVLALELEASGYKVFLAQDGLEGLKAAQKVHPDLIITDVLMPRMDGNQFLKKLRETESGRKIPFMILTARGKMRDYFETVHVDAFIEKPFAADDLLTKVEEILKHAQTEDPKRSGTDTGRDLVNKKRVLIVENDLWTLNYFQTIFNDYGYNAKVVKSIGECLEEAVSFNPDLIISKYILEEMNANRLVDLLRKMPHLRNVPIVVYSKTIMGGEKESVLSAGGTDFIFDANGIKLLKKANEIFHNV